MFSSEFCLGTQGFEPGAAGSRSKHANHCAMLTVCLHLVESYLLTSLVKQSEVLFESSALWRVSRYIRLFRMAAKIYYMP